MHRTVIMSLFVAISTLQVIGFCPASSFAQDTKATNWKGTLDARGTELRLEIRIEQNGGKFLGELLSVDQNNAKLKLAKVNLDAKVLEFRVPKIGAKFSAKLSSDGTVADGTFTQSGIKLPLKLTKSDEAPTGGQPSIQAEKLIAAWVGKIDMGGMKPIMQFRVVELESGETSAYFDSITEGRTGFKATYSLEDKKISFDVEEIGLTYRGTINGIGIAEGTWSQGGRDVPLTLKRQKTEFDNENVWENRPQRPVGPFPYDAIEVTFKNTDHDVTLAGTLTIPKKTGRHPVVVLISGSGPQDRDESLMEHKPFLVLADYLSRQGIAVLRYDDRGAYESTGDFAAATSQDFAYDASAAFEFLKTHDRINPNEIGLAGHSEGGLIAPMVVEMRDDVAFVVLMAATGVDGEEISASQGEAMLRVAGADESEIETGLAVSRAVMGAVKASKPDEDLSKVLDAALEKVIATIPEDKRESAGKEIRKGIEGQKHRLGSKWMRFFLSHDPAKILAKMKCPTLAIIGSKDIQVLPKLNMPPIEKALKIAGNQDFEMVELEGLNHLFQKCDTGSMDEYVSIQETINPVALKRIGDWILKRTNVVD